MSYPPPPTPKRTTDSNTYFLLHVLRSAYTIKDAVYQQGFSDCRVRHHGTVGRIELPTDELARAMEPGIRAALVAAGKDTGFQHVTIDLDGIRSGLFSLQVIGTGAGAHG